MSKRTSAKATAAADAKPAATTEAKAPDVVVTTALDPLTGAQGDGASAADQNTTLTGEVLSPEIVPVVAPAPEPEPEPDDQDGEAELAQAVLANHTPSRQVLRPLALALEPGESKTMTFRDAEHETKCRAHIANLARLNGWGEGEGLHWSTQQ